jgi:hypothetical protein
MAADASIPAASSHRAMDGAVAYESTRSFLLNVMDKPSPFRILR